METKTLRFEGVSGKLENQYVLSMPVPAKLDLLTMIEKPPFHIFSKDDITYSTGILSFVPHSMKVRISRDYQEPFVGVYIRISPKSDEIIEISEVKGTFTIDADTPGGMNYSSSITKNGPALRAQTFGSSTFYENGSRTVYNTTSNNTTSNNSSNPVPASDSQVVSFNFFKNSVSKLLDLENYDYYESRCQWPDVPGQLDLYIKVTKITLTCSHYWALGIDSVLVDDNSSTCESLEQPKNSVPSATYFLSDLFSDVTIHVGDVVFPAHKIILAEKSRYFARMFANSMRETKEGIVRISDEDESLFREILRFIYQGTVENMEEHGSELFILSDKYDIPELSAFCERHLLKHLSVDNAMEMFDLSQSIVAQGPLAKKSKELIMWNREKFASDLHTFKEFSRKYPEIIFELLQLQ